MTGETKLENIQKVGNYLQSFDDHRRGASSSSKHTPPQMEQQWNLKS